jgi:hypothetical protein
MFGFEDFNFKTYNNKLLDPDNLFIDSIESGKNIFLSGEVSNTGYSYYLNNVPISLNKPKNISKRNTFIYDFQNGFLNLKNLKFLGVFLGIDLSFPNYIEVGQNVTGTITNISDKTFQINSGVIDSYYNFKLESLSTGIYSPNSTGQIIISSSGLNPSINYENFLINLNLFTDSNNSKKSIYLNSKKTDVNYFIFSGSNINYSNLDAGLGESIEGYNILNYEFITGQKINSQESLYGNKEVEIKLSYLSGYTGNYQSSIIGSGITNVNFSGDITGYGYMFKNIDIIGTGKNPSNNLNYINTINQKVYSDLIIVSGFVENQNVSALSTGNASGEFITAYPISVILNESKAINLSNNIFGFGLLTGITSGIGISQNGITGSGIFYYNSGSYFFGNYNFNPQNIQTTGMYDGEVVGLNYFNTGYYTGQFSGIVTGSGFINSDYASYNATGIISGDLNNRIIEKNITNKLSIPAVATGYVNINLNYLGFGLATGDYTNTNILGNIIEYTGNVNSNYTGFVNGTGYLFVSGSNILKNKYGEEKLTTYLDFITYEANGNPNNINSPENIVNYTYSCVGTGLKYTTGINGVLGISYEEGYKIFTGDIIETGLVTHNEYNLYKATGLNFNLLNNNFYSNPVTGYIEDRGTYSIRTGFTGKCDFLGEYAIKFYGIGTGAKDGEIYEEDHPRIGYINKIYQLNTGIFFETNDSGVKNIIITRPAIEFIENGIMPNLIRDFTISPPIVKPGSSIWVSSGNLTDTNLRGDAETKFLVIPNSGDIHCPWENDPNSPNYGLRSSACGGSTYHTYYLESGYNNWFGPPREKMLTGYLTLTGSGFMETSYPINNITGILISGNGSLLTTQNITGSDFEYITGYRKVVSKLRTQTIENNIFSGFDNTIVNRTGIFSIPVTKSVTGFNYSQIEFTYTGIMTGELKNILINNSSGYLSTGVYLERSKNEINLNNFKYLNIDNNIYDLNLNAISNLSGSGIGIIPATGFLVKNFGGVFALTNTINDSGKFLVTGLNLGSNMVLNYTVDDFGVKNINQFVTGLIKNPRIYNSTIDINSNAVIGTGVINSSVTGSGFCEKNIDVINISGDIPLGNKVFGNYIDIKNIEYTLTGNAIDGVVEYNNIVTGYSNGLLYSGYVTNFTPVKTYILNKNILITGLMNDPLNYNINFENSYSISTGYYDVNSNNVNYKNLNFIDNIYSGKAILPNNAKQLYIKTQLKEHKNDNPISANLTILGNNASGISVINMQYKNPRTI